MSETTRRNSFEAPSKTKKTTMELNNHDSNENLENKRTAWSGKLQFFMSIISYSVGLGNIWRFPYLCHQNGGGAFLVSYFIMLILEGIPIFLIELGIGQRLRQGAFGVWNTIHPCLGGIGISSCIVTFFVALYYNIIIAWCFFYFFSSLRSTLAWTDCPKNTTTDDYVEEYSKSSSTAYYWYRVTLDASPSIEQVLTVFFIRGITLKGAIIGLQHMFTPQIGKLLDPRMWLDAAVQVFFSFGSAFGSLIAFGSYNPVDNNCVRDVILVSICNGFTAIYASIVVFTILGFKAVSNVEKCLQSNRILLQLHGLLNDVNDPEEKYQNAVDFYSHSLVPMNFTLEKCSVSEQLNQAAEGTGLAFIVFTQAIVELPSAPFWSCIFFLMLLTLGLGTQIGLLEGMLCVVFEMNFFKKIKKPYLTGIICTICFFIGLIFCTGAGEYWLEFFDNFASTIGLVLIALMEVIAVAYVYGYEKFSKDIEFMTGYKPGFYWKITWRFLAPIFITVVLISSIVSMLIIKPKYSTWDPSLGKKITTEYPNWVLIIGICMIFVGIAPIPIVFLLNKYKCFGINMNTHQKNIYWVNTTESRKEPVPDRNRASLENFPEDNKDNDNQDINHICNNLHKNITPKEIQVKSFKMDVLDY
ncbi:Similar to Slc6a18: Sodium-dependent neutral amino acid transporter B(0)AT3 (Mus musculus) [Cotesia congregata]|uniref:Transporter n=1 Tax=Cotesia congregata TaxID=51543 RepID=A0A8J2HPA5_COTCN|nr:Similar to Slc6a18: Sodium-dependent neutral amino acid transporter B(0)AT3 (Mus musculus) [Cotesia congregata]